LTATDSNK